MLPAMGFLKRIWKSLSTGDPEIGGGDPEAVGILKEEYGAGDPNVPLDSPTATSPIGQGELSGFNKVGEVAQEGERATDEPAQPDKPAEPAEPAEPAP
jgi:hypothetical protein